MAERVLSAFRKPWAIDGRELQSTASIGVAIFPEHGDEPRTLLKHADTAMYRVKNRGGNDYESYAQAILIKLLREIAGALLAASDVRGDGSALANAMTDPSADAVLKSILSELERLIEDPFRLASTRH